MPDTRIVRVPGVWVRGALLIVVVVAAANLWKLAAGLDSNPLLHRAALSYIEDDGILPGEHTIDPNDGYTLQALARAAGDQWLDGDVPYWNRYEGIGTPLAGEMQSMAMHPFVLLHQLPKGFLLAQIAMESLAGIATMLLLRRLGIGPLVSIGAGIAYGFNGTFAWLSNAAAAPVAYLPLLLLGIEVARESSQRARRGGWSLIAVAIAGSLLSGFPETAYINGLFAVVWCLVRIEQMPRRAIRSFAIKLGLGIVAGAMIAAPAVVAFLDYLPNANIGGHEGTLSRAFLPRESIPALYLPYVYGPIHAFSGHTTSPNIVGFWSSVGGYLSSAQLMLAVLTFGVRRLRRVQIGIGIWFAIFLCKTYGFRPVTTVVNWFPGMNELAFFRYSQPSVAMGMLILAAYGAQRALDEQLSRRHVATAAAAVAVVLLALGLYARTETRHFHGAAHATWYFAGSIVFALGSVCAAGALTAVRRIRWRAVGFASVLGVEAMALFVLPQLSTDRMSPPDMAPVEFLRDTLGLHRFYTLGPISPNYGSEFGIASINQNDLPVPKAWGEYIVTHLDANADPLLFTGFSRAVLEGPSAVDELVRNLSNYADVGTAYVVAWAEPTTTERLEAAGLTVVFDDGFVRIFAVPNPADYFQIVDSWCELTPVDWKTADVSCVEPSTLIRLELADDGWSAKVNGDEVEVVTHDGVFQSIAVPAGDSRITFGFAPTHIGLAWLAALVGGLAAVGASVASRRNRMSIGPELEARELEAGGDRAPGERPVGEGPG
ncbi:MAG: hypothetical protein AB7U39_04860 [Ilumatobacteraceae bacterium]